MFHGLGEQKFPREGVKYIEVSQNFNKPKLFFLINILKPNDPICSVTFILDCFVSF